jgi:hypothetical protein
LATETRDDSRREREAVGAARKLLRRFDSWIGRLSPARGAVVVVGLALTVWVLQSVAYPVGAGRDLGTYLRYYAQMWDWDAVLPQAMLGRTPGTPIVTGLVLEVGPVAVEVLMAVLFVASVLAWTLAAATFGRRAAVLVAAILLLYPGYGALFHEFSSDALSAAGFALWALAAVRVSLRPSAGRFLLLGVGVVALVLIRPGNQVLLAFGLAPLVLGGLWRVRIARSAAFLGAAIGLLALWAGHNAVRYDDFAVARGTNIALPFYRAFAEVTIVSPEYGPASLRVARAVEERLLTEGLRSWDRPDEPSPGGDRGWRTSHRSRTVSQGDPTTRSSATSAEAVSTGTYAADVGGTSAASTNSGLRHAAVALERRQWRWWGRRRIRNDRRGRACASKAVGG